tara:strand:+ start:70 stop:327 length:258 start_codon:yes stop_codon:yes gene_type:complete
MQDYSLVQVVQGLQMKTVLYSMPEGVSDFEAATIRLLDIVFLEFTLNKDADNGVRVIKILDIFLGYDTRNKDVLKISGTIPIYTI